MKRHHPPEPHVHTFLLPSTGSRVEGKCVCGAVKVFENLFVPAPRFAFGHENRSKMLEMMANERRATRVAVITEETSLAEMAQNWQKGTG